MTLAPLFQADLAVQIHAFAALALVPLTIFMFARPKGQRAHRIFGWAWVLGMGLVAGSSFFVTGFRMFGPYSPIHLLSVMALFALYQGVRAARRKHVSAHRKVMRQLSFGALGVAGLLTFWPGRTMFLVVTGG